MFDSKDKEAVGGFEMREEDAETIIGASVKVDGDFVSEGNVLVQGIVNGSLKTKGNLRVDEGAKIKANVDATNAQVSGEIQGNITVKDSLDLGSSAKVAGDIITKILSIEPGAVLNGHCSVSAMSEESEGNDQPSEIQKPNQKNKKSVLDENLD
ncbi:MAG: cell shape determination protein CcmA [Parcubacteria group bacterium CG11_big_fil_rev_8_21_14_0_20_41_14]|nr:MAG: cell shape determination protein CcmA [Parcubacteria group bacterium CG22_combo_CG10-13_8_21_14_all_41_9]PIQ80144.1 MAG: cell shape determination protein CcmA [Parcubacteria group bacterium CG11_big_fil_rev_8_21_14_0_20_41_14]PIR57574.1 MAG: cell shape determination protein CcmA [Parcubacteria group bacterium CG10_big_fil_rev_8_21_14_0_10_41_35]PIZ80855.1 MAG: cell shape determination protein CcmA [Parcubacteria group bacterium CG_4_10_14_0_2_um_filter_41_6]